MKKILSGALVTIMLISQLFVSSYATVQIENVALGKTIYTEVPKSDAGSNTEAMVDGKIMVNGAGETRWYVRKNCEDAWFDIYLGKETTLYYAMVYSGADTDVSGVASDFKLQQYTSNGWVDIDGADISGNEKMKKRVDFAEPVKTDKVRFVSKMESEFRIREFELYGEVQAVISSSVTKKEADEESAASKFKKDSSFLAALGILGNSETLTESELITRAEFVDLAMRAFGYRQAIYSSDDSTYDDVGTANKYYTSIMNAKKLNVISSESKNFYPDNYIHKNESAKIVMSLMGYSEFANRNGGYPYGYVKATRRAGMDMAYAKNAEGNITNGEAIRFICEAMEGYPLEDSGYENGVVQTTSDKTAFEIIYNGNKEKGIVEANEVSSLYSQNLGAGKGEVIINGNRYKAGNSDAAEFLGYYTEFYSVEDAGTDKVVYIYADEGKNKTLTLVADDLIPEKSSVRSISYYDNKKERQANISSKAYILQNGKFENAFNPNDLKNNSVYVTLVDWENDGTYDFMNVKIYDTLVVSGVDETTKRIRSRNGEKVIDLLNDGKDLYYTIKKSGQRVGLSTIKEGNVISVAFSSDKSAVEILVSEQKVSGTVDAIEDDGDVSIGDESYGVYSDDVKINLSDSGTFYIDVFGKIAYFEEETSTEKYGLICSIGQTGSNINPKIQIKLLDESGNLQIYNVQKKYKLNKNSVKAADIIGNVAFYDGAAVKNELIRYKNNAQGEITEIITQTDRSAQTDKAYNKDILSLDIKLGKVKYKSQLLSVSGKNTYAIDINKPIFFTTTDAQIRELQLDECVYSGKASEFLSDYTTIDGTISLYDVNDDGMPGAIVVYDYSPTMVPTTNQIAVVKRALNGKDENGQDTMYLKLFKEGSDTQIELPESAKVITSLAAAKNEGMLTTYFGEYYVPEYSGYNKSDLKMGDIILYSQRNGKITYWQYVYKNGDTTNRVIQQTGGDSGFYANLETMFVKLKKMTDDVITFVDTSGTEYSYLNDKIRVAIFDSRQKDVYAGTIDDLVTIVNDNSQENNLFVRTQVKAVKDIIIYK